MYACIYVCRVLKGFGKLWSVVEIEDVIFQDLQSLGKEDFQKGYRKVLDFCLKNYIIYQNGCSRICYSCSFYYL